MTSTACDDQFAPEPGSREAAIDAMVMEVQPHEWRQGGAMRYQGHLITWGEYVQRRRVMTEGWHQAQDDLADAWDTGDKRIDRVAQSDTNPSEPEAPAWNGEGLPPAGIRCEALRSHGWVEVYVVGYCEDGYCVFDTGSDFKGNKDPNKFRPIRSEEDRLIDEALDILEADGDDKRTIYSTVARMICHGYRKPGGE